jgi:hypothetical protein
MYCARRPYITVQQYDDSQGKKADSQLFFTGLESPTGMGGNS